MKVKGTWLRSGVNEPNFIGFGKFTKGAPFKARGVFHQWRLLS